MLAAITNALAPDGATLEEAAARYAMAECLSALYEKWGVETGGLERLQAMKTSDIREAVRDSLSAYIFYRWALELGLAIERGAVSENQAVVIEREMRQYVRDTLLLTVGATDVLSIDWKSDAGRNIIDQVFEDAYSLIETKK